MVHISQGYKKTLSEKWGFLLVLGFLTSIMFSVGTARAFGDQRVDVPNPKVEPLVDENDELPSLDGLVDGYYGPGDYAVEVAADWAVSVKIRWCARTENILDQNLSHMDFFFEVNNRDMLSRLHNFEEVDKDESGDEMYCHGYRGLLSDWPTGEHDIRYALVFAEQVNDGWDVFPSGEIVWAFDVSVIAAEGVPGAAPMISVTTNTNCRVGPGKAYELIGGLKVGETAEVVGKYLDADYWIIFDKDIGRECWLWGRYAQVSGNTDALRIYEAPPLPTPTPTPEPSLMYRFCFCNNTGSYISSLQLFNDDTDQWMGEFAGDGFPPGYCICNCNSNGQPYPAGDYAVQYKICEDGAACQFLSGTHTQGFDDQSGTQMFEIAP